MNLLQALEIDQAKILQIRQNVPLLSLVLKSDQSIKVWVKKN